MGISDKIIGSEGTWLMGSFIPKKFLEQLADHLTIIAPDDADDVLARIRGRTDELVEQEQANIVDGPSKGMIAMSSVVLAAYESIEPRIGADRAILVLRHVFGEILQRSMATVTKVLTDRKDPLSTLDKAMRSSSGMYGGSFDFDFDRPDDSTFEMRVTTCFFNEFFERHDAKIVTTVLCSWDANWMKAIDTPVTGLRAERTSLMSLGSDACRFRVLKTDDPTAGYTDVLDGQG